MTFYFMMDRSIDGRPPAGERLSRREKYRRLRSRAREQQQHVDYIRGIGPPGLHPPTDEAPPLIRSHGSIDDIKGSNSGEPDSFWDISVYSNGQTRSVPHGQAPVNNRETDANPNYARIVRKKPPRRHTVGGSTLLPQDHEIEDNSRRRQAFMDMLAQRYPQFSEKISGTASEDGYPVRTRRPRDHQRRRTVVTYNPDHNSSLEYEDPETMSNIEGPVSHFSRGGFIRSSLPIVRSPPNTFDRPIGLVFLIYGNETKKSVLPNEITHLDTVRALFVRSFPGKLSMQSLQSSKRKIYILESRTNIYYLLEDLRDIKDRTVLKVYEYESDEPQKVKEQVPEVRGKTTAPPRDDTPPRVPPHHGDTPATAITDQVRKAQTLPQTSMARSYPPFVDGHPTDLERPKSHTLDTSRGRSHPSHYGRSMYQSPDRQVVTPDRNLRPIPENLQILNGYPQGNIYEDFDGRSQPDYPYQQIYAVHPGHPLIRSMSPPAPRTQPPPGDPIRRAMSPPPGAFSGHYDQFRATGAPGAPPQTYVAKSIRAPTGVTPSRATGPDGDARNVVVNNRHSLAFTPMSEVPAGHVGPQRSQSYRVSPDKEPHYVVPVRPRSVTPQPVVQDVETKYRMDQMEAQIANLAAWVQTAVSNESSRASSVRSTTPSEVLAANIGKVEQDKGVCTKGISDVSSVSQHTITQDIKDSILNIRKQTGDLRTDLRSIRRMQQLNKESMQDSIQETMGKIKKALSVVPGTEQHMLRKHRVELDTLYHDYENDKKEVMRELSDLESSVEETRADVITHQCRVNLSDVEGMALILSHITKSLGDLKHKFSNLQSRMKQIMSGEMEIVVKEEKYLKDEPDRMEEALKRCKKLTGTLFTLKRLASVQEHRPPQQPSHIAMGGKIPSDEDKKAVLENIQAMVPNHEARLHSLEAADASRERKKKITTQQETLKFGKSLEIASKALKSSVPVAKEPSVKTVTSSSHHPVSSVITSSPHQVSSVSSSSTTKSTSSDSSHSKFSLPLSVAPDKSNIRSKQPSPKPRVPSKSVSPPRSSKVHVTESRSDGLSETDDKDSKDLVSVSDKNNAARAAFFSSLTTPPTSPSEEKRIISPVSTTKMDYTVRISPIRTTSSGVTQYTVAKSVPVTSSHVASTTTKPTSLPVSTKKSNTGYKSSSPSPNSPNMSMIPGAFGKSTTSSNIPRFSTPKTDSVDNLPQSKLEKCNIPRSSTPKSAISGGEFKMATVKTDDFPKTSTPKTDQITKSVSQGHKKETIESTAPSEKYKDTPKTCDIQSDTTVKSVEQGAVDSAVVKPKKVPPPPPPRKSSKHPIHVPSVESEASILSPVKMELSRPQSELDSTKMLTSQDSSVLIGYQIGIAQPGVTLTSTPKPELLPKPNSSKFEMGLASGKRAKYSKEKEGLEKTAKGDSLESENKSTEIQKDDSNSESSGDSVDSQQGASLISRRSSSSSVDGARKPKPPPPKRHSSLSGQPKPDILSEQVPNGKTSTSTDDGRLV